MKYKKQKKGFTLIESIASIAIVGGVSSLFILNEMKKEKEIFSYNFVNEISSIINAVDQKIAIDGYSTDSWSKLLWSDEEDIVSNLLSKNLVSIQSSCSGGEWVPSVTSERKTNLIKCGLWNKRKGIDLDMSAEIKLDNIGYIQNFEIILRFNDLNEFEENFINIKNGLKKQFAYNKKEVSGLHSFSLIDSLNMEEITAFECLKTPLDCSIKASFERSGGSEYLRVDGSNSIIDEKLIFVEGKGNSQLKCIKWSNTKRDGSGFWSPLSDEECGIGIYKNGSNPVVVDAVGKNGTFKSVLLDKECDLFEWDGSNVISSTSLNKTPCGISSNGSEIYQVVDNTMSSRAIMEDIYVKNGVFNNIKVNKLDIKIGNIDEIVTKNLNSEIINISKDLNILGIADFKKLVSFEKDIILKNGTFDSINIKENTVVSDKIKVLENATLTGELTVKLETEITGKTTSKKDITIAGETNIKGSLIVNDELTIEENLNVTQELILKKESFFNGDSVFKNNIKIDNDLTFNTAVVTNVISLKQIATNSMTSPVGDFENIKKELDELKRAFAYLKSGQVVQDICSQNSRSYQTEETCPSGQRGIKKNYTTITSYLKQDGTCGTTTDVISDSNCAASSGLYASGDWCWSTSVYGLKGWILC